MLHDKDKLLRLFSIVACSAALSCFNPFFPQTGKPPGSVFSNQRGTPLGVIQQLNSAYQKRDIDLYRDLFSMEQDFRFYVPPSLLSSHLTGTCEQVDTVQCPFVASKGFTCLNYWTFSEEMRSHTNLFEKASLISLSCKTVDPNDIRYITSGNGETLNVEVILRGGRLTWEGQVQADSLGNSFQDYYEVEDIGLQVFYLEKDPQNATLWVIKKWFDLNGNE
jgi:hypothetical protein